MSEAAKSAGIEVPSEDPGLQKIDLQLALKLPGDYNIDSLADPLLSIFGRWRLEKGEEIVDLADYAHVPEGPSCLLVGHRWHFGIAWFGGNPSLFLSTRKHLTGSLAERITQALETLFAKSKRLLAEKEIPSVVQPRFGDLLITINDRLLYPNTEESDREVGPAVREVVEKLYGTKLSVEREPNPDRRLAYHVHAADDGLDFDSAADRL